MAARMVGGLEDQHLVVEPDVLAQAIRGGEPRDPAADDDDAHQTVRL